MSLIEYNIDQRIAFITLNRPDKRNALSYDLIAALKDALDNAGKDEKVKAVILRANGEAFSAGADLSYLQKLQRFTYEENLADSNHLKELYLKIYTHPKVVVAQIQGHALAGGCGLATVCDWSFAVPEAKFGYTEVRIGFIPALVSVFLLRKVGEAAARELLLGGELFSAHEALSMGLISRVVPAEALEKEVLEFTTHLISLNSSNSMGLTKKLIAEVSGLSIEEGLKVAAAINAEARSSEDCKRGVDAFLNKEKIIW
jgi:methylglutaconyl-CoA hydratase